MLINKSHQSKWKTHWPTRNVTFLSLLFLKGFDNDFIPQKNDSSPESL